MRLADASSVPLLRRRVHRNAAAQLSPEDVSSQLASSGGESAESRGADGSAYDEGTEEAEAGNDADRRRRRRRSGGESGRSRVRSNSGKGRKSGEPGRTALDLMTGTRQAALRKASLGSSSVSSISASKADSSSSATTGSHSSRHCGGKHSRRRRLGLGSGCSGSSRSVTKLDLGVLVAARNGTVVKRASSSTTTTSASASSASASTSVASTTTSDAKIRDTSSASPTEATVSASTSPKSTVPSLCLDPLVVDTENSSRPVVPALSLSRGDGDTDTDDEDGEPVEEFTLGECLVDVSSLPDEYRDMMSRLNNTLSEMGGQQLTFEEVALLIAPESVENSDDDDDEEDEEDQDQDQDEGEDRSGQVDEPSDSSKKAVSDMALLKKDVVDTIDDALDHPDEPNAWETALIASLSEELKQSRLANQKHLAKLGQEQEENERLNERIVLLERKLQESRVMMDQKLSEAQERIEALEAQVASSQQSSAGVLEETKHREQELTLEVSRLRNRNVELRNKMSVQTAKTRESHAKRVATLRSQNRELTQRNKRLEDRCSSLNDRLTLLMKETIDAVFTPRGLIPSARGSASGPAVGAPQPSPAAARTDTRAHPSTQGGQNRSLSSFSQQLKASIENPNIVLRKVSAELNTPRGKRQAAAMDSSLLGVIAKALVERRHFLEKTPRDLPPPTARWNEPGAWDP